MPKLTTQAIAEVTIAPDVATRLAAMLSTYNDLKAQAEVLDVVMDEEKAKIKALLDEAGVKSVIIDGVPLTITSKKNSTFDKVRFVELGGSLKLIDDCTSKKDGKPFLRVGASKD